MPDQHFQFKIRAANLPARGFFGRGIMNSKFKLSAFQMGQTEPFYVVYESETMEGNSSPTWKRGSVPEGLFSDPELPVMISVFDKLANGQENPVGTVETSVNEMKRRAVGNTDQVDAKKIYKLKDANGKEAGLIVVVSAVLVNADEIEPEPSEHPDPEPVTPQRASTASTQPDLLSSTPQSTRSITSSAPSSERRLSETGGGGGGSAVLEIARMQQTLMDLNRKMEKLEKETTDLRKETSDLRTENDELKGRVKYLENSLKQDRKLMEMAQKDISDLKAGGGGSTLNGSKHTPNPSVLDGSLTNGDGVGGMDDKSSKSKTSSRDRGDRHHSSSSKKGSDHVSSSTLSTIDSDKSSTMNDRSTKSNRSTPRRHASSPRRGSMDSKMSTKSSRSHTSSSRSRSGQGGSSSRDGKSPSRSMRRSRSTDDGERTSDRSTRGGRRPGGGSSGKDKLRAAASKIKAAESLKK